MTSDNAMTPPPVATGPTPGPWSWSFIDGLRIALTGPDDREDVLLVTGNIEGRIFAAVDDADAALIEVAPMLLAALGPVVREAMAYCGGDPAELVGATWPTGITMTGEELLAAVRAVAAVQGSA